MSQAPTIENEVLALPPASVIRDRLIRVMTEAKRLKLLLRTAAKIEQVEKSAAAEISNPDDAEVWNEWSDKMRTQKVAS